MLVIICSKSVLDYLDKKLIQFACACSTKSLLIACFGTMHFLWEQKKLKIREIQKMTTKANLQSDEIYFHQNTTKGHQQGTDALPTVL